jgi:tetratricopeptide (TPR) repeat protein
MRKRSGFLFVIAACLLMQACLHPAPAPDQGRGDAVRHLVTAKPKLMSADYRGDVDELARLREEVLRLADDSALGYLARYWAGFASWRIAINGANRGMSMQDITANMEKAAADLDASIRLKDDFADAYAAAAGVHGWLAGAYRDDPAAMRERIERSRRLLARALELEPDNPRALWVQAAPLLFLPPERGGDVKRAIEIYRRMDEVSQAASDTASPLPDWGKPEALMSLAYAHLQQSPPDLAAAIGEARAALRLWSGWSYVRDVLLPQIEAA